MIEPINSALHRHLPRDIKAGDLDAIVALYATDTIGGLSWDVPRDISAGFAEQRLRWEGPAADEPVRRRYARLLAEFATIERGAAAL